MKTKDDLEINGLQLPNIPIKIVRLGNKLKLTVGDYTLELNEIDNGQSQTYPLLLLDKFCSEVTTKLLEAEIDRRKNHAAVKKSLELLGVNANDEVADNVIRQIHEAEFGGQE